MVWVQGQDVGGTASGDGLPADSLQATHSTLWLETWSLGQAGLE